MSGKITGTDLTKKNLTDHLSKLREMDKTDELIMEAKDMKMEEAREYADSISTGCSCFRDEGGCDWCIAYYDYLEGEV